MHSARSACLAIIIAVSSVSATELGYERTQGSTDLASDSPAFLMNRGAVFSESESIAATLGESLSGLIGAIQSGEITDQHIADEDRERYSFFMGALRRLKSNQDRPMATPLVLRSFSPDGDESFLVSVAFMSPRESGDQIEKIIEFHAYPHGEGYRFKSPFEYRTRHLRTLDVHEVRYHFAGELDAGGAEAFVAFKREFERRLGESPTALEYYCFETLDEILRAYGIEYDCTRCNWLKEDLGFMDDGGRVFLTGSGNERFVFDYLVDYMSEFRDGAGDLYPPFVYGMGAYYGGYGLSGDDLDTLKAQFRGELEKRPDMDFLKEYRKERKSSIHRHFTYFVIGAFLCEEVLEHHGFEGMMRLAHSGRSGEGFFEELDSLLGIDESNFHDTIVRLIQVDG